MAPPSLFGASQPVTLPKLCVGTSGYSFRDWVGPFYPLRVPARQHLQYYANHFPCLEVNVTHYRMPDTTLLQGMCERTPATFAFIVKLHRSMTHELQRDASLYRAFGAALQPMRDAGKLQGVLAQFPFRFRNSARNRSHVNCLRQQFADTPFFAEFRHLSWLDDSWFAHMQREDISYVSVDEPQLRDLLPPVAQATTDIGYVRLHGRNRDTWYAKDPAQGDRYDYLYGESELQEWAQRIRQMIQETRRVFVLFNNCHAGKAPANAQAMQEMLALLS
jgi:uncharacterized protein YecE (DUF72 family)